MEHSRQMSSDVAAFFAYANHADVVNYHQIICKLLYSPFTTLHINYVILFGYGRVGIGMP